MHITSLGYRTDLMLLSLHGSRLDDHGSHLVVHSPHNPTHWWGNFILWGAPPAAGDLAVWEQRFTHSFPDAGHRCFGLDGTDGDLGAIDQFRAAGYTVELSTVLTASAVHEPPRPNHEATYRPLDLDDAGDLESAVDVQMAGNDRLEPVAYRRYVDAKMASMLELQSAGLGRWFGAFLDGRMYSGLGLFTDGSGLARFQSVDTRPDTRGRGLASSLVHYASVYGLGDLGAHTLVMVADPDYLAIRIYRSVGFADTETQVQLERPPADALA
ncbi:MAG: GNAT family N-acetyltransferase [Nocardioidaceae bacterium]